MEDCDKIRSSLIAYECKSQIKMAKKVIASALAGIDDEILIQQAQLHAMSLLHRSINLKHDRLTIERFRVAVQLNARIDKNTIEYCRQLAIDLGAIHF